jgi:hypothetical protein
VVDRRGQLRLALEALAEGLILGAIVGDQLDRDRSIEPPVGRSVDDAHSAAADQPVDAPVAEIAAGGQFPHEQESGRKVCSGRPLMM